jgi:hypothetical protein
MNGVLGRVQRQAAKTFEFLRNFAARAGEPVARACVMCPFCHRVVLAASVTAGILVPTAASAVTVDQIVGLAHAGVTETVILALIDRDKTIFSLEPEQLVMLKAEGVSEPVLIAMLKSGREEGERAAQAAADLTAAMILAERSPGPEVVIIGHGPELPNVAHPNGFYSGPPGGGYFAVPYLVDGGHRRGRRAGLASQPYVAPFTSPFREGLASPAIAPVVPAIAPVVPPIAPAVPAVAAQRPR